MEHYTSSSDSAAANFCWAESLIKAALTEANHGFISDFPLFNPHLSVTGKPAVAGADLIWLTMARLCSSPWRPSCRRRYERIQSFDAAMMTTCFTSAERRRIARSRQPDRGGDFVMVPERSRRQGNRRRACVGIGREPEDLAVFSRRLPKRSRTRSGLPLFARPARSIP